MITGKTISIAFLILFSLQAYAQQNHFVYIKADNGKKFSATINDSVYAAVSGFIIMPRLKNGEYNLAVHIAGANMPKNFNLTINSTDYGFALKDLGEKGWCLYDYNTAGIITAMPDKPGEDVFGSMLSQVTNDSSIMAYPVPEGKNTVTAIDKDTAIKPKQDISQTIKETLPVVAAGSIILPDTAKEKTVQPIIFDTVASIVPDSAILESKEVENPFFETKSLLDSAKPIDSIIAVVPGKTAPVVMKDEITCTKYLSEQDLDKLRRKMFAASGDEKMIAFAVKAIGEKCMNTAQIKTLGLLFSTDSGRYRLFEALNKNVEDKENLKTLGSQLINPYYKNLFSALIQ